MRKFVTNMMMLGLVCFAAQDASATIMMTDFEAEGAAMGENALISTVGVATFSVFGGGGPTGVPRLAAPGLANRGFANTVDGSDTPDQSSPLLAPGNFYFLTNGSQNPNDQRNYGIDFSVNVEDVKVQLYDYRADGNTGDGNPGVDSVDFIGYLGGAVVDTFSWTVPDPRPNDGNIVQLALTPGVLVDRVEVVLNGIDLGTGIDNLMFNTVPEPSGALFLMFGIAGLACMRRR